MDVLKGFSERLIELMQENGLNAEKLSKKLGVAPTIIRRWCLPQKDIYYSMGRTRILSKRSINN